MEPRPHNTLKNFVGVVAFSCGLIAVIVGLFGLVCLVLGRDPSAREAFQLFVGAFFGAGVLYFVEDVCWRLPLEMCPQYTQEEHRNDSEHQAN
jgi:hypothetical protein